MTTSLCVTCKPGKDNTSVGLGGSSTPTSPQFIDRYAYVHNNPLGCTDPDGLCFRDVVTGKMSPCDRRTLFNWMVCANSPEACRLVGGGDNSEAIYLYARYGVATPEFKVSMYEYGEDPASYVSDLPRDVQTLVARAYFGTKDAFGLYFTDPIIGVIGDAFDAAMDFYNDHDCAIAIAGAAAACTVSGASILALIPSGGLSELVGAVARPTCTAAAGLVWKTCVFS